MGRTAPVRRLKTPSRVRWRAFEAWVNSTGCDKWRCPVSRFISDKGKVSTEELRRETIGNPERDQ